MADDRQLPIPDLRPAGRSAVSEDVLDVVAQCTERQAWYRGHVGAIGDGPVEVVGSLRVGTEIVVAAASMREALAFDVDQRRSSWTDASLRLAANAEEIGVLVMASGIVGANSRRKLDPQEFTAFVLADDVAPVVFLNGALPRPLHLFALSHALAHVWLGRSGLLAVNVRDAGGGDVERWCNRVAAEFVVPADALRERFTADDALDEALVRLARVFKASAPVLLRRLHDTGLLPEADAGGGYEALYDAALERLVADAEARKGSGGGNFYNTQPVRVSKRFARTLLASTMQGRTSDAVALQMLGVKSPATLKELGRRLGVD